MKRVLVCLVLLLGAGLPRAAAAPADDVGAAADAAQAAFDAGDATALAAEAQKETPGPWVVADELCARRSFEAAAALAKVIRPREREALAAFVAARRTGPDEQSLRSAYQEAWGEFRQGRMAEGIARLEAARGQPASVLVHQMLATQGAAMGRSGRAAEGLERMLAAGRVAEQLGWLDAAFYRLYEAGQMTMRMQDLERAAQVWALALPAAEKAGLVGISGEVAMRLGQVLDYRGDLEGAARAAEKAVAVFRGLKQQSYEAMALGMLGIVRTKQGRYDEALALQGQALAVHEALGDEATAAKVLGNTAAIHRGRGDLRKAVEVVLEALRRVRALGLRAEVASQQASLGEYYRILGEYAEALSRLQEAASIYEALQDKMGMGYVLGRLGAVYGNLRDFERAFELQRRALALYEEIGATSRIAEAREALAALHDGVGQYAEAVALYKQTLAQREQEGDEGRIADTLLSMGGVLARLGKLDEALAAGRRALSLVKASADPLDRAYAQVTLGDTLSLKGRHAEAERMLQEALEAAREGQDPRLLMAIHETRVEAAARSEAHKDAVAAARDAAATLRTYLHELADEELARASERWVRCLATGASAAARLGRVDDAFHLLEAGRARALSAALGGWQVLHDTVVPPALLAVERTAREEEAAAAAALRRAVRSGAPAKDVTAARKALARARAQIEAVTQQIQRELKVAADVVNPEPVELATLRAALAQHEALVLFSLSAERATAVVVTRKDARVVDLGPGEPLRALCAKVLADETGALDAESLAALAKRVVDPLQLPKPVRRLLVAPDGGLAYVPIALLAPGREIVHVPSATAMHLLRRAASTPARAAGGVLALGDPAYGEDDDAQGSGLLRSGLDLTRLPSSGEEARAVGDPVLLGSAATEEGLFEALATQPHWRAVHLACHGLVDAERPAFCALALTPSEHSDGFLTALEVMRHRIPADLVVLSACQTARGRRYEGEGILGLTRSFMLAGASGVLVSLWKVDDGATRLLMERFYAAWKEPGVDAATALTRAQEAVRTHEALVLDAEASRKARRDVRVKTHPYAAPRFWAGWALWGSAR